MTKELIPESLNKFLKKEGYEYLRMLPTGEIAGLLPFLFTIGLVVGMDKHGYRTRFCYPNAIEAYNAIKKWDGHGDPPGPWIKQKGGIERSNPNIKQEHQND